MLFTYLINSTLKYIFLKKSLFEFSEAPYFYDCLLFLPHRRSAFRVRIFGPFGMRTVFEMVF